MNDLILRQAAVEGRSSLVDICINHGEIVEITEGAEERAVQEMNLNGQLVLPAFVDCHTHLDKCLVAEKFDRQANTLDEARVMMNRVKQEFTRRDVKDRARRAIAMAVCHGTTAIRTHIDVDDVVGLLSLEALLELRDELSDAVDLQFALTSRQQIVHSFAGQ